MLSQKEESVIPLPTTAITTAPDSARRNNAQPTIKTDQLLIQSKNQSIFSWISEKFINLLDTTIGVLIRFIYDKSFSFVSKKPEASTASTNPTKQAQIPAQTQGNQNPAIRGAQNSSVEASREEKKSSSVNPSSGASIANNITQTNDSSSPQDAIILAETVPVINDNPQDPDKEKTDDNSKVIQTTNNPQDDSQAVNANPKDSSDKNRSSCLYRSR